MQVKYWVWVQIWQRQALSPLMQELVWQQQSKQQGIMRKHPFPGSHCSLADKEVSASGRDGALCCLPGREQRDHYSPAASGLKFFHWDVASWDCCFFLCICRCLSHHYYVHEVVLKAIRVSELNSCSHKPSESQKASCSLRLSGISKLCGHKEFQYIADILFCMCPEKFCSQRMLIKNFNRRFNSQATWICLAFKYCPQH